MMQKWVGGTWWIRWQNKGEDGETGWNKFDASVGRWFSQDPYKQFHSPYSAMAYNPVMYVDSDGRWVHIAAGAIIGGGIAAYDLYSKGQLDLSWRSVGKIAVGVGVGAATAALPSVAIGATGSLIATSTAAGGIGAVGELLDRALDVHTGYQEAMSLSDVGIKFATSSIQFGLAGKSFSYFRYNSIMNMGTVRSSSVSNYFYRSPGNVSLLTDGPISNLWIEC